MAFSPAMSQQQLNCRLLTENEDLKIQVDALKKMVMSLVAQGLDSGQNHEQIA